MNLWRSSLILPYAWDAVLRVLGILKFFIWIMQLKNELRTGLLVVERALRHIEKVELVLAHRRIYLCSMVLESFFLKAGVSAEMIEVAYVNDA